jgi:hypothetical protein
VVAVGQALIVAIAAIRLAQFSVQNVWHTDTLIDRRGRNGGPLGANHNQPEAGDRSKQNKSSVHACSPRFD